MKLKKKLRNAMHPFMLHVIVPIVYVLLRMLFKSWRKKIHNSIEGNPSLLVALPHCEILVGTSEIKTAGNKVVVLQSPSKDGELVTRLVHFFGGYSVIGSSFKNPVRAMYGVIEKAKEGATVIICFDGPRGPRNQMTPGIVYASAITQVPIAIMVSKAEKEWRVNSWDKTKIPKPFSKIDIYRDTPIAPPKSTDPEEIERVRLLVQERINELYRDKE